MIFAMGAGAWVGEAYAQRLPPPSEARPTDWTLGISAGVWGRVPVDPSGEPTRNDALDISVQRRIGGIWGEASVPAVRLQIGHGSGRGGDERSFDYHRVMAGFVREYSIISNRRRPFYVHLGAGVGAYRVTSAGRRLTKSSLFAQAGFDVRLGSSPLTLGPEVQVHTIGDLLYGTTSIVARIRLP